MKARPWTTLGGGLVMLVAGLSTAVAGQDTEHIAGPNGLEGWTDPQVLEGGQEVSFTLTIARHGTVVRRIAGDPIIYRWIFWKAGREIVYETGPLHFGLACVRLDLASGRELDRVDCFRWPDDVPAGGWPDWVQSLEKSP